MTLFAFADTDSSGGARENGGNDRDLFEIDGIPEPDQVGLDRVGLPRPSREEQAAFSDIPDNVDLPAMPSQGPKPLPRSHVEPGGEGGPPDPFAVAEPTPLHPYAAPEVSPDEVHSVDKPKRVFKLDYLLAVLLAIFGFGTVVFTQTGIGMTWDEAYYYRPGERTIEWLKAFFDPGRNAVTPEAIDSYFGAAEDIPELPMTPKLIFAFGLWLGEHFHIAPPYLAMRLPVAACYGLTLLFLYLLAGKYYARAGAILTVLCYMIIPRVFGHAHVAGAETILIFFSVLLTYCFVQGLGHWGWSIAAGAVFGFALATKINAVFFPLTLILWAHIFERRYYINNLFSFIFISPLVMIAIWPWLWPNPSFRFLQYIEFFITHKNIPVLYFGKVYPYAGAEGLIITPWHYPFLMTAYVTPLLVLILALLGLARTLVNLRKHDIGVLFLLQALGPLAVSALPFSPKYDGVRLFLPAFPFLALLAGIGAEGLIASVRGFRVIHQRRHEANFVTAIMAALIAGYGLVILSAYHPHYLSYWNLMFGGLKGAHRAQMETTYWGEAVDESVYHYLNDLPAGTHIRPLALHDRTFQLLQEWNVLDSDLVIDTSPPGDVILMQVREGFFGPEERFLFDHRDQIGQILVGSAEIPFVVAFDLRKNPPLAYEARQFWPNIGDADVVRWIQQRSSDSGPRPEADSAFPLTDVEDAP